MSNRLQEAQGSVADKAERGVAGARNPGLLEPDKLVSLGKDLGFHLSLLNNLGDGCEDLMAGQWQ